MHRFLESAIRYSGAEKGYVLTSHEEGFTIEEQAGDHKDVRNEASFVETIVRYVARTGEPVVLGNASRSLFTTDAYAHRSLPLSILCMPILFPGQMRDSHDIVSPPILSVQDSLLLVETLTTREMEMLYAFADGLSNKEIAYRFGLTEGTVKSYVFNLYGKLGAKRRAQAIARARGIGLLE
ncbi:helix-turn-helix transcriptional regulator [Paenibacillus ferrarius]|nr:LuxR C-terminal-related transcriptional regulator [Paenibacillus ferrarius]